jgi:hypothetical protein
MRVLTKAIAAAGGDGCAETEAISRSGRNKAEGMPSFVRQHPDDCGRSIIFDSNVLLDLRAFSA